MKIMIGNSVKKPTIIARNRNNDNINYSLFTHFSELLKNNRIMYSCLRVFQNMNRVCQHLEMKEKTKLSYTYWVSSIGICV